MRKNDEIFVAQLSFEKLDFFQFLEARAENWGVF